MKKILEKLIRKENLEDEEMKDIFEEIMDGKKTDSQIAGFLSALESKGLSVDEIYQAARVLREKSYLGEFENIDGIDTCGTGGDGKNLINISTISSIVCASAGVKIIKHGNRSVSGNSGSADLLENLGVNIDMSPKTALECFKKTGITFLFAQRYHKAMKNVARVRNEMKIKTIFNIIGPLCNPANVSTQLMGVSDEKLTEQMARVLQKLGSKRAMVVYGMDHVDEISLSSITKVSELKDGKIRTYYIDPRNHGFELCSQDELRGDGPRENAIKTLEILNAIESKAKDAIVINSAAIIYLSGIASDLDEGIKIAKDEIESLRALKKLEEFKLYSQEDRYAE